MEQNRSKTVAKSADFSFAQTEQIRNKYGTNRVSFFFELVSKIETELKQNNTKTRPYPPGHYINAERPPAFEADGLFLCAIRLEFLQLFPALPLRYPPGVTSQRSGSGRSFPERENKFGRM